MSEKLIYDLIIIGGGPAGLSAGIYAGRAMLDTLIIEKEKIGGQVVTTTTITNYPGIKSVTGPELMGEMYEQVKEFGVETKTTNITSIELDADVKKIHTESGTFEGRSIIIATGASARQIGFKGENEFRGRGIAYCSTCDGEFFKDMDIFVIGGGYAAAEEAIYLTRYGKSVTMIIRKSDFSCAPMIADMAKNHPNITIRYNTEVEEVSGDSFMNKATFINNQTGEKTIHESEEGFGMFVFAGTEPQTDLFKGHVALDESGYIPTSPLMETNIAGVYAAGDLLPKELRQIVTAVSDGAIAATTAQKYVFDQKHRLGLPAVTERIAKRIGTVSHVEVKEEKVSKEVKTSSSQWFPEAMQEQLKGVFSKLTKQVTVLTFTNPNEQKSIEMTAFMKELVALNENIVLKEASKEQVSSYGVTRFPSAILLNESSENTGIKFTGVPSGHELNSLVLAIYNVGSQGQPIESTTVEKIKSLPKTNLRICVSLTCHYCPEVVAACQRIASLHPNIEAEMIDVAVAPELKQEKKIMSVPAIIVNDEEVVFGAKKMDEIIEIISNTQVVSN